MWPFGRKTHKDLSELPSPSSPGSWGVAQAQHEGAPLLIRINMGAKDWRAHPGLPIRLGFAIPLRKPNEGGLPEPAENEQLGSIEDQIFDRVGAVTAACPAFVLTTGTMREVVFYIPEGVDIKSLHESIMGAVSTHEVQCMAVVDKRWDAYRQFAP